MKSAIIIMAKAPIAGMVKTRLIPFLSAEQSAELAACLLTDTVNKTFGLQSQLIIAYAPPEQRSFFDQFTSHNIIFCKQHGDDLGEKIYSAFQFAFERDFESVAMIGTDSPTFPPKFLEQTFKLLEARSDAVLGRTTDGGFYLIGLRVLKKEIFENIEWSSERTFEQTARNIKNAGLKLEEIPAWYDIDEPRDLERLAKDFERNESMQKNAPHTFQWLERNIKAGLMIIPGVE